jgi:hypothetical protein
MKFHTILLVAALLGACTSTAGTTENSGTSLASNAPIAPAAVELVRIPATPRGDGFALVVAPPSGDAVERWGLCLARVADCYVPGGDLRTRERCLATTDSPPPAGENVCPRSCREDFERALAASHDSEAAVDATYKQGDCVSGFRSASDGALRKLNLEPRKLPTNLGGTP